MTRNKLKEHYIKNYAYIAVGNYDVITRFTNDGESCYIAEGIYFTKKEWFAFLNEVRLEYEKRNNIKTKPQGTTAKAYLDKLNNKQQ